MLGVARGPEDGLVRLLFECWPRCLRDAKAATLDSALTERQIAVYGFHVPRPYAREATRRVGDAAVAFRSARQHDAATFDVDSRSGAR